MTSPPTLGANQLKSVVSPIAASTGSDTVLYTYDALNRPTGMTINGAEQSTGFDALGRINSASNPLDSFIYSYSDATPRVSGVTSNDGPTSAMTYYGPTGDELLKQMNFTTHTGGTSLAQFGYTYDADDNVKSTTLSSPSAQTSNYAYDTANRLLTSTLSGASTPQYAYGYDPASNLLSITPNGPQQNYTYTVTNTIVGGTYNSNGSPIILAGNTYTWDGANRVLTFANSASSTSSSFTYNGIGRLVRVIDYHSGSLVADHSYTWCGSMLCLAHDNTQSGSPVSAQYFGQGVISGTTPYYYVQDRLGSVMQMISGSGNVAAQYSYDPYGNRTTVSGTLASAVGYAGYFYNATSGLDFTLNRAYDPTHARWLNRDPIGEAGGVNLYAYVNGNPVSDTDPLGLWLISGGFYGSNVAPVGGAFGGGFYLSYSNGQWAYGAYTTAQVEGGANISAGFVFNVYPLGDTDTLGGRTNEANFGTEAIGGDLIYSTSGELVGGGLSFGPSLTPIYYSAGGSNTWLFGKTNGCPKQ